MDNFINKIYEENKHKELTKEEVEEMIYFLIKKCKYPLEKLKTHYIKSGVSALLFLTELEKFQLNHSKI